MDTKLQIIKCPLKGELKSAVGHEYNVNESTTCTIDKNEARIKTTVTVSSPMVLQQ